MCYISFPVTSSKPYESPQKSFFQRFVTKNYHVFNMFTAPRTFGILVQPTWLLLTLLHCAIMSRYRYRTPPNNAIKRAPKPGAVSSTTYLPTTADATLPVATAVPLLHISLQRHLPPHCSYPKTRRRLQQERQHQLQ